MVHCINQPISAELVECRVNVGLDAEHVFRFELLVLSQQAIDALGAIWGAPLGTQAVLVSIGRDAAIGCGNHPARRIKDAGQLLEWEITTPLVGVISS